MQWKRTSCFFCVIITSPVSEIEDFERVPENIVASPYGFAIILLPADAIRDCWRVPRSLVTRLRLVIITSRRERRQSLRRLREHCYSLVLVIITSPVGEIEDFGGVPPQSIAIPRQDRPVSP